MNFFVVALPFSFWSTIGYFFNFFFNIGLNKWWADGNLFLVANTVYLLVQGFQSVFLIYEIPAYLRHHKIARAISFETAIIYNIVYFIAALKLYQMIYWADHEEDTYGTVMVMFFFAYNLVMNIPNVYVNIAIIMKEFALEKFQLIQRHTNAEMDDISLGYADTIRGF